MTTYPHDLEALHLWKRQFRGAFNSMAELEIVHYTGPPLKLAGSKGRNVFAGARGQICAPTPGIGYQHPPIAAAAVADTSPAYPASSEAAAGTNVSRDSRAPTSSTTKSPSLPVLRLISPLPLCYLRHRIRPSSRRRRHMRRHQRRPVLQTTSLLVSLTFSS